MAADITTFTDRQLAFHEAGHAVLAAHFGEAVARVSIVPRPEGRQLDTAAPHPGLGPAEVLVVLLGGEEAQRRLEGGEPVAAGDRERARQVLTAAGLEEAPGQRLLAEGRERAGHLLHEARLWRQVEAVASALLVEGTLDGDRFRDLLASA